MNFFKKLFFSLLPALILFLLIEGGARLYWSSLQNQVFKQIEEGFRDQLERDNGEFQKIYKAVNFLKTPHPFLGYVLTPNLRVTEDIITNSQGFFQKEEVALQKKANSLRIMTVGESSTQGAYITYCNYPASLRILFKDSNTKFSEGVEVINAGVAGWVSDQWALASKLKFAAYKPDIVIFYCGWNDFQSYSPYGPPPEASYYKYWESNSAKLLSTPPLKSVTLLKEWIGAKVEKYKRKRGALPDSSDKTIVKPGLEQPQELYKFFTRNLTQAITAFKEQNPNVKIIISTLVGRWPHDTQEQFEDSQGRTWWMIDNKTTRTEAARLLGLLNGVIENYAKENKFYFVDMDKAFNGLNKQKLFIDFCHLTHEGYEILAKTFFEYITKNML